MTASAFPDPSAWMLVLVELLLLAGASLGWIVPRAAPRVLPVLTATALLAALVAASAAGHGNASGPGTTGFLLREPLSGCVPAVLLVFGMLCLLAVPLPAAPPAAPSLRHRQAAAGPSLLLAGGVLAATASSPAIALVGLCGCGIPFVWSDRNAGEGRTPVLLLWMLAPFALGIAVLSGTIGRPLDWAALADERTAWGSPLATELGALLMMVGLLAWAALFLLPPRDGERDRFRPLWIPMLPVIAMLLMRVRGAASPEISGVCAVVLAAFGLWQMAAAAFGTERTDAAVRRRATGAQLGMLWLSLGAGGAGGCQAAILLALLVPVAAIAAMLAPEDGGKGTFARLMLAGLPPSGLFAADFAVLLRLWGWHSWLAVLATALLATAIVRVVPREAPRAAGGASPSDGRWRDRAAIGLLILMVLAGVAMPAPVSDALLAAGEPFAAGPRADPGPAAGTGGDPGHVPAGPGGAS
ncbi:hypothetical protein [Rhizosaccharibacter radicis]|uniref:NADH:quinone oxidoreductase/Mrp antiporter membrane subunit domain-containing protein n=1 Tax=Rhizosaccharibacter radicis TaxID=2782605 RepID=A0ABT1VX99_9PROT|nr:hypothetical protein [Acetobacteraceae bacterium KSS12]